MRIQIISYNELKFLTAILPADGTMELADDATVRTALKNLRLPDGIGVDLVLFVNGRPARLDTHLNEGDKLVFFSPICGG